jgi:hydroxymethylpyrimidine/phosphomethylpyrimidine kinase
MSTEPRPAVLAIGGNDPTGGAGLAADVETLAAHGCRACPVVTAVTVQTSVSVLGFQTVAAALVRDQMRAVLDDLPVQAIKIGMLGSAENAEAVAEVLGGHPALPVVLDPVLRAGGGGDLSRQGLVDAIVELLPLTGLATPNRDEARHLAGRDGDIEQIAAALLQRGCPAVLITGADEGEGKVENHLFLRDGEAHGYSWPRLPGSYHGSGCTLASAIAALLARGMDLPAAAREAQAYAAQTLRHASRPGQGQYLPDRMYWAGSRLPTAPAG